MSRTYEFLEDRMSYLNKDTLNKYYGTKIQYQFMPKAGDISTLEKYIIKEENDLVRGSLNRPVVMVEVKRAEEAGKFLMEWSVGLRAWNSNRKVFQLKRNYILWKRLKMWQCG